MRTLHSIVLFTTLSFFGCATRTPIVNCPKPTTGAKVEQTKKAGIRRVGAMQLDGIPKLPERIHRRMSQYLGVRRASFVDWDERGNGMLVRTRFGNTVQIHRVKQPMGSRKQLTFFPEPISKASWIPGSYDGALLVRMDRGGAENAQLYRLDLLEGRTTRLTDGKSRTLGLVWSRQGALLAYASNARNGKDFDIYVGSAKKDAPFQRVYQGKGLFMPLDFSFDGKRLLLLQYISLNESYIHVLDIKSKRATAISFASKKAPQKVSVRDARFSLDGRGFFFTSDRDGQFVGLHYYDLRSKTSTPLTARIKWNVEAIDISTDGRRLAFSTNEHGYSRLYTMDTRSHRYRPVKLPDGIIRDLKFSRNKKTRSLLGFSHYLPTSPGDAYSYDLRRNKLERWTQSEVGGLNADFFVSPKIVSYPTFDKVKGKPRRIPAFYFKPPGAGPHPVLINIHGGPESQYRPFFRSLTHYLVMELGVAVLAPNVRGSDGYGKDYLLLDNGKKREDSVKDIGALLDWVGRQKELDSKKVVVYGGSYGGYMVLASLTHYDSRLLAGVDWVGISNFVTFLKNTKAYRRDLRRAEYGDERDPAMRKFLEGIAPLNRVERIKSPLFVIQGANDPRVPRSEAEQLVSAVRKNGREVWYLMAENEGHGFRKKENRNMADMLTVLFLESVGLHSPRRN